METIHKLQPNRTIHLKGFDDFGAAAALTKATDSGFTVSGVFRDAADFAVLVLHDADSFFEHPRIKPLPDFDFTGVVLEFDVSYSGLQALDSIKYPTIDWPYLDGIKQDESTFQVRISDHITATTGAVQASATVTITANNPTQYVDRVTVWYQNIAFDYLAKGGETGADVAKNIAGQINAVQWGGAQAVTATAGGSTITVKAAKAGADGNMITLYAQSYGPGLTASPGVIPLVGGKDADSWHVRLDFSSLGLTAIRQMWLTFAPQIANGSAYQDTEWQAVFSNWTVTGAAPLKVAGPGSVRIEESDSWCVYGGKGWSTVSGFYSKGFARATSVGGDSVTVKYYCQHQHDLYLGTGLYPGRGHLSVTLDGAALSAVSCAVSSDSEIPARRLLRSGVPSGQHTVVLKAAGDGPVYFDFLEAAVLSDVPDAPGPWTDRSPAIDYDTDHGYKLSPARLMWMMDSLGYQGGLNLYEGVFWWNQRKRSGGSVASASVDFGQTTYDPGTGYGNGDQVFVKIGDQSVGKSVFPADTAASIAAHFAWFINSTYSGAWASVSGTLLTVTCRAAGHAYDLSLSASVYRAATKQTEVLATSGSLSGGVVSQWVIDTAQTPVMNRAARDWLADLAGECAARGRELTVSYSLELVNPPAEWAARFPLPIPDGTKVETATGFGTLLSTQCAPIPALAAYQSAVYVETAAILTAAELTPVLQFGEWLWWYYADHGGMAYYDAATQAAAQAALGRPLALFAKPTSDPSVNGYADANFLREQLDAHMRTVREAVLGAHPGARFEILLPLDVLAAQPAGHYKVGGALNHYVSIPDTFRSPETAPFDRIKIEALDFELSSRDHDLFLSALRWPYTEASWPKSLCRYNLGVSNGGAPWARALAAAQASGIAEVILWAWDHVNLFGWPVDDPVISPSAQIL